MKWNIYDDCQENWKTYYNFHANRENEKKNIRNNREKDMKGGMLKHEMPKIRLQIIITLKYED